jgi:dihydroorotate dehydrogenase
VLARRRKPIFVKLPSHHDEAGARNVAEMVRRAADQGFDGISVSGSQTIDIPRFPRDRGSIAGRPVFEDALRITRDVATWSAGRLSIRSAGGVFSAAHAEAMLAAGADAVEVYSAFVYNGPFIARDINGGLLAELDRRGLPSVGALTRRWSRAEPMGGDDGLAVETGEKANQVLQAT